MKANNVTRLLDAQHIRYTLFETLAEKPGAIETAVILGVATQQGI
jgi:hypothetical protein